MTEQPARRFPPPWEIEDHANGACFIMRDINGQALAYAYYESEPGRRAAAKLSREMKLGGSQSYRQDAGDWSGPNTEQGGRTTRSSGTQHSGPP